MDKIQKHYITYRHGSETTMDSSCLVERIAQYLSIQVSDRSPLITNLLLPFNYFEAVTVLLFIYKSIIAVHVTNATWIIVAYITKF